VPTRPSVLGTQGIQNGPYGPARQPRAAIRGTGAQLPKQLKRIAVTVVHEVPCGQAEAGIAK
jgi:hypothetical protein